MFKFSVKTLRAAGLEAKWVRTANGAPCMVARNPMSAYRHQRETWYVVTNNMFSDMESIGAVKAFESHTFLGDLFSIGVE